MRLASSIYEGERSGRGERALPTVLRAARATLLSRRWSRARNQWRSISPCASTDASSRRRSSVIQNRDDRAIAQFARLPFTRTHTEFRPVRLSVRLDSARLGSGPLGLAWLGSAWLAQPRARTPQHAVRARAKRSPPESHACQRRPAQIMVGCVERRGGGCGDCGYETRGRRRSFLVAYVVSSLSLPFTRSVPLPRTTARSLARTPSPSAPRSAAAAIALKTVQRNVPRPDATGGVNRGTG